MLILDAEIKRLIVGKGFEPPADIETCDGWDDFEGMGISVVCALDMWNYRPRVFLEDNLEQLQGAIDEAGWVVTYNGHRFDGPLLAAHGVTIREENHVDLLVEIWRGLGLPLEYSRKHHKGLSLDAVCKANGVAGKSGEAVMAPIDWQRGNRGRVIDYCMDDCRALMQLYIMAVQDGELVDPRWPDGSEVIKLKDYGLMRGDRD